MNDFLSKHDIACRLSDATGRGYENILMDLNRIPTSSLNPDRSSIALRNVAKYARSQGLSDSSFASEISDLTGQGWENVLMKMNAVPISSLPRSSEGLPSSHLLHTNRHPGPGFAPSFLPPGGATRLAGTVFGSRSGECCTDHLAVVKNSNKSDSERLRALQSIIDEEAFGELLAVVNDSDRYDSWRLKALRALVRAGCVEELFKIVNNSDRYDSWRLEALTALCDMAPHSDEAARCLYQLVNDSDRYDSWRLKAMRALIHAGRRDYLERIASNTDRYDSWRAECRRALESM
ncbi:MAG: hypothetical protein WC299_06205 [Kiritimatiellia bacterium]